ncbi:MAG: hypothetical protein IPM45_15635 [Acidimicrobiales bacterium]|nr:hypothetical protein [Acidimicrobiales bacterium]
MTADAERAAVARIAYAFGTPASPVIVTETCTEPTAGDVIALAADLARADGRRMVGRPDVAAAKRVLGADRVKVTG